MEKLEGKMKRHFLNLGVFILAALSLVLAGCGGSGSSGSDGSSAPGRENVSGVAAAGTPIVGTVYLKDASNPAKELSMPISTDGTYTFEVSGLTRPFLLKAVGTVGGTGYTVYSVAAGPGTANINPLTELIATHAAAGVDLAAVYDSPEATKMQALAANLAQAVSDMQTLLQPLFSKFGVSGVNPISDAFIANHQGLDLLLDSISVQTVNGTMTITNKRTGAVIFTAPSSDMMSGAMTIQNIPDLPAQPSTPAAPYSVKVNTIEVAPTNIAINQSFSIHWNVSYNSTTNPDGYILDFHINKTPTTDPAITALTRQFSVMSKAEDVTLNCTYENSLMGNYMMCSSPDGRQYGGMLFGSVFDLSKPVYGIAQASIIDGYDSVTDSKATGALTFAK
jgi:hypothetical protein